MVKCADCGFLAVYRWGLTEIEDASLVLRDNRALYPNPQGAIEDVLPICFLAEKHLGEALEAFDDGRKLVNQLRNHGQVTDRAYWLVQMDSAIQKEHSCPSFVPYRIGFSPKEHREMLDRQWMLEREERRDRDAREWQERESSTNRKWRFWEFVVAVIALIVIVIAAFIERGAKAPVVNVQPPVNNVTIQLPMQPMPSPEPQSQTSSATPSPSAIP